MLSYGKPGPWEEVLLLSPVTLNNKSPQGHLEVGSIHVIISNTEYFLLSIENIF